MYNSYIYVRGRAVAVSLVLALAGGLLGLLGASPASAAIGDFPLITYNMQGSTGGGDSKWSTTIGGYANQAEIVALQEAGEGPPGTPVGVISGDQLASTDWQQLPDGLNEVRHNSWANGFASQDVYWLQTDRNGGTNVGGRVNLAMVTHRPAEEVAILRNPLWTPTNTGPRATLGLLFSGTWYFNLHALSGGGNDVPGLIDAIDFFVQNRGQGESWVAMGDFNREPETLRDPLANPPVDRLSDTPAATIYRSGQPTHQSGHELDYMIASGLRTGVQVQRLAGASSDHYAVAAGSLYGVAQPTQVFGGNTAVESMQAGGVMGALQDGTADGTAVTSFARNGNPSQSWTVGRYSDGSLRFQNTGSSTRCMDITNSTSNPGSGRSLSLFGCTDQTSQRWTPEYLGDSEYQLHSLLLPNLCVNISGGQSDPLVSKPLILYACQNTPNERFTFTAGGGPSSDPVVGDLPYFLPETTTLESMRAGGVMNVADNGTTDGTAVIQRHRNGGSNQGWKLVWRDGTTASFQGVGSNRCLDINNSTTATAGRSTVIWGCTGQSSQEWQVSQKNNATYTVRSVLDPTLCLDVSGAPTNPDTSFIDVYTCNGQSNQEWIFTPFDPNGAPTPDQDTVPDHDELLAQPPSPGQPANRVAYYPSWSIYANAFYPKNLDTQGIAGKLTTLDYAFENIDPTNLTCMEANKASSNDESSTDGNDGSSDAYADYQKEYDSTTSVDGSSDTWSQPLRGNFQQLKELKAKYPNLKILVSLGGWTYSKFFSDVAATDASRKKFVSSCLDMYIKGNLPQLADDPAGGTGAAAGIFDGFDIDWEFPGSANGHAGNHYSAADTANYSALLHEFRTELDALGGQHHQLTAALPSGPGDISQLQVGQIASDLDMGDVMTYDMHGAFETTGPTNFQAPLYDSAQSPASGSGLTADDAINSYLENGFPNDKLTLGVPFYGRGWTGVPDGGAQGLYQTVTGPTASFPFSQEPGVAMYKELETAGKLTDTDLHFDPQTQSNWVYDGTNFWSVETPQSLAFKRQYIKDKGLAGIMMYSLEADDSSSTLLNAATGLG